MRRLLAALACVGCASTLSGCYSGKGTESATASPPTGTTAARGFAGSPGAALKPGGFGTLRYSFAQHFAQGAINSEAPVSTPNHRGALLMPVVVHGTRSEALTLTATFRYSYKVDVPPGSVLAFEAAKPLSLGVDTYAFVDVGAGGKVQRVFAAALPPASADGVTWRSFSTSLERYAGKNVTFTFGADPLAGNATAAWVEFADAGIYASKGRKR